MTNDRRPLDAAGNLKECSQPVPTGLRLGQDVVTQLTEWMPTRISNATATRCLEELRLMVKHLGPDWDVQVFGSYANGFGTRFSDLDVTCCQSAPAMVHDSRQAMLTLGQQILPMVREHDRFSIVEEILGARIPILKLRFENVLDVDMSCHNPTPLLNSRLLKAYSVIDGRIRDLGIAIKLWAKGAGLCDATKSNLSSYSFTLLVLYFMQVHAEVQIPVLSTEEIAAMPEQEACRLAAAAASNWYCPLSLSELMSRFFAFYSGHGDYGFCWGTEVVSVRCGSRRAIDDSVFFSLRGKQARRIHVEDPYQMERNLHAVLGDAEEEQLRAAFREAFNTMPVKPVPRAPLPYQAHGRWAPGNEHFPGASEKLSYGYMAGRIGTRKAATETESGTDSTQSARTVQAGLSDSDDESSAKSSVKSSCGPSAVNIPLPRLLLKR